MKRIMLSLGFVALCGSAFATEAETTTESVDCACDHHDGISFGLGVLYDFVGDNITAKGFKSCTFDGAPDVAEWADVNPAALNKKSLGNKFAGTVTLAIGKALSNKIYLGGEIFCNFGQNKSEDLEGVISGKTVAAATIGQVFVPGAAPVAGANPAAADVFGASKGILKSNGVSFGIAARMGYVLANGFMPYVKAGMVYSKGSFDLVATQDAAAIVAVPADVLLSKKVNKWQPQIGLGLQKTFCKKIITRLEAMYTFKSDMQHNYASDIDGAALAFGADAAVGDLKGKIKHRKGGNFSLGLSVAYNVKI